VQPVVVSRSFGDQGGEFSALRQRSRFAISFLTIILRQSSLPSVIG
jgi:hypothetical protein